MKEKNRKEEERPEEKCKIKLSQNSKEKVIDEPKRVKAKHQDNCIYRNRSNSS